MKSNPSVDVIIPTYNGLPYLKESVESVLGQSHENLLLYVVDDGSTDNGKTKRYVKSLSDKRVRYLHKDNGGQATARNYGIQHSDSPYVTFLDSDDIWHKDKLKTQVDLLERAPDLGMVYGLCRLIDEKGVNRGVVNHKRQGALYKYLLGGNRISGSASMVMVRRSVIDNVGLFREDFLIGEDWEMWLRIARSYDIGCVNRYLANLRVLPGGMQSTYIKMAIGLDYMLPILIKEFKPGFIGKAKLRGACLWDAAEYYYLGRDQVRARRAMLRLMVYNPFKLRSIRRYWFMYLRVLLGSESVRRLRSGISPDYRIRDLERKKIIKENREKYG